jgi:hypothetical protein
VLLSDTKHDDEARKHLSSNQDAPAPRTVERTGYILAGHRWARCIIKVSGFDLR